MEVLPGVLPDRKNLGRLCVLLEKDCYMFELSS